MSNYLAERIRKQRFHKVYPLQPVTDKPRYIIGFDSEADTTVGKPMLFQFSLPFSDEDDTLLVTIPDKRHAGWRAFVEVIDKHCTKRDVEYVIYGWNVAYELTQIFHDLPDSVKIRTNYTLRGAGAKKILGPKLSAWDVEIVNEKRQIITFKKGRVEVKFLDGTAFFKTSLDNAAKMLGLGEKYQSDEIDRTLFTRDDLDNPEFLKYSRRDAYITRLIGEYIQARHKEYSIPTTISAPQFAATVFRTEFLKGSFVCGSRDIEQAGLYSYHGGKNGFYLDGPTEFATIYQYDITSAYPEAMIQLPNIETAVWRRIKYYKPEQHALYCVTMDYNPCQYRGMQDHDGRWTPAGLVIDQWLTGYELDQIVIHGEGKILSAHGYVLDGDSGGPLSEYVKRFFAIKRTKDGPEREFAKLLLNSLYGKFFQKQALGRVGHFDLDNLRWISTDPTTDFDYEAGGLYNPPTASLITGYVRAKIHRLEHKYDSIMTSTDGLFGMVPPDDSDLGTELGQLTAVKGRLRIWRERLYIFDSEDGKRKFALHGFHARPEQLESIPLARGEYQYYGKQMITLKMSTRNMAEVKYDPGQFVQLPYVLRI